ncbi:MAG: hypothetical protein E7294_10260 [Lachnospiraceae bacterium]|nr:hypothetical protein [Lachnospiraceae bacterium]
MSNYQKIMDKVVITDEMRERICRNVETECAKEQPAEKAQNNKILPFFRKYTPVMATCAAAVLVLVCLSRAGLFHIGADKSQNSSMEAACDSAAPAADYEMAEATEEAAKNYDEYGMKDSTQTDSADVAASDAAGSTEDAAEDASATSSESREALQGQKKDVDSNDMEGTDSVWKPCGLFVTAENVTAKKATLVFEQKDVPIEGELSFGEDFVLQKKEGKIWKEADIVLEGEYGFNDIAHLITPEDRTEYEYDWEWLYGTLAPGEYRVGINVSHRKDESGFFEKKRMYAYFAVSE